MLEALIWFAAILGSTLLGGGLAMAGITIFEIIKYRKG